MPNARLVLVGATADALPGIPHETWAWSEETEVDSIRAFHVGIMPLSDTPWERGKCGFKLIQYMAAGRPVVASPVGVNTSVVADGVSGYLASETDAWVRAIERLRTDGSLRASMGQDGRSRVEAAYALQVTAPRLARLLHEAAAPPTPHPPAP
jgi:glycosyltransferase involved in cell wall biosynthesis